MLRLAAARVFERFLQSPQFVATFRRGAKQKRGGWRWPSSDCPPSYVTVLPAGKSDRGRRAVGGTAAVSASTRRKSCAARGGWESTSSRPGANQRPSKVGLRPATAGAIAPGATRCDRLGQPCSEGAGLVPHHRDHARDQRIGRRRWRPKAMRKAKEKRPSPVFLRSELPARTSGKWGEDGGGGDDRAGEGTWDVADRQ